MWLLRCHTLVVLFMCIGSVVSAQNLLSNPGFESWTENGWIGPPDDWSLKPDTSFTATQESTIVNNGSYSSNLTWTTQNNREFQQVVHGIVPGTVYELEVLAWDNDSAGRCRFFGYFQTSSGTNTGSAVSSDYTFDDASWQLIGVADAVAPVDAAQFLFSFRCYDIAASWDGDATVYVDDAYFAETLDPIFADGFEFGDTRAWSMVVP